MPLISGAQRNNRGRPNATSSNAQQNHRRAELPEYEPPSCPLDNASRRALAELSTNNADTRKYEEQLKQSITLLTNSVRDINDRYVKRKQSLKRLQERRRGQSEEGEGVEESKKSERERAEEEAFVRLREEVPSLTEECDSAVRAVIDLRVELEDGRKAIQDTVRKVEFESANAAERNREGGNNDDEDDDDLVMGNTQRDILGPLRILKHEKRKAAADYATRSMEQRYAVDNDYIGFKRLWWDSVHSVDGKPLPDATRWFTRNGGADEDEGDEEEDLVIAEEHISIYCPLSMVIMEEPYTSRTCKHTFNKPAIVQFLRSQPGRTAKCPQTGCSKEVTINDFYDDQVMVRKIKREQAEKERGDVEDDDEDEEEVDEDGDESIDIPQQRSVKAERARSRGRQLLANLGLNEEEDAI
ncbi:hypothetical protein F5Y19DRAFT_22606 [Xylariaceae sp. FL1651]|nr:hypothetical protein F5Y19DRAFT_22606 [Xylariaceae sp. FL1651]